MQVCTSLQQRWPRLRHRLRQERGQSIVEFAVVLPVLIMLILGILYFGRYEDYSNQETQLAESGVRMAAVDNNPSGVSLQSYILSLAQPELQYGSSDVKQAKVFLYYPTGSSNTLGNSVRACVVTTVSFPTPMVTPSTTIAQAATMRIEQLATAGEWTADSASTAQAAGCPIS
jgi:Flp pilus assembly protein TadG